MLPLHTPSCEVFGSPKKSFPGKAYVKICRFLEVGKHRNLLPLSKGQPLDAASCAKGARKVRREKGGETPRSGARFLTGFSGYLGISMGFPYWAIKKSLANRVVFSWSFSLAHGPTDDMLGLTNDLKELDNTSYEKY